MSQPNETNEPVEVEEHQEHEKKESGLCCDDPKLFCCDPNGDGKGKPTCCCRISWGNWGIILALFFWWYCFIGCFFWAMIQALFAVKDKGDPRLLDGVHIGSPPSG